jgi:hypothetical protein
MHTSNNIATSNKLSGNVELWDSWPGPSENKNDIKTHKIMTAPTNNQYRVKKKLID